MLSPSVAALVAVSLLVTIYRVLRGRPSAAIRRSICGPPSPSVLLGQCCFRDWPSWVLRVTLEIVGKGQCRGLSAPRLCRLP